MRPARTYPKPLADLVAPALGPALAAQGFTGGDVVASWPEIVGERLASASRPLRVEWPRHRDAPGGYGRSGREPAALVVRVEGAFALELQHLAPLVLERVNAVYGWRCVGRLVLKQGPTGATRAAPRRPASPDPVSLRRIEDKVGALESEPLRAALTRLGCEVVGSEASSADGMSLPQSS